jgi:hypothetical protein
MFKWCLLHGMKRGGGGNGCGMRCGARGSVSMMGRSRGGGIRRRRKAGGSGAPLLWCGRRKKRPGGPKTEEKFISEKLDF